MKLVQIKCPACGSNLNMEEGQKQVKCDFCRNTIYLDDEVQHIQYDNPEDAGYLFEKGRQRAIHEFQEQEKEEQKRQEQGKQSQQSGTYYAPPRQELYRENPEKKHTLLWILGWIFFFPAPVMVLIWRKKNTWDIKVKIIVTIIFWLFVIIIGSMDNSAKTETGTEDIEKIPEFSVLKTEYGLFENIQLDESRTCVYWSDRVDLPSDTLYEYGKRVDL